MPELVLFLRVQYLKAKQNRHELQKYASLQAADSVSVSGTCAFGDHTKAGERTRLFDVSLGNHSYFMEDCFARNCTIGAYCSIAPHAVIGLGQHPVNFVSTHPAFYFDTKQKMFTYADEKYVQEFPQSAHIMIGNDVWIGQGALVRDGVAIGNGAIIGAGAVVVKDVEPYSIVGGVPARLIRYRFEPEEIAFLQKFKWWEKNEAWLKENWKYFSDIKKLMAKYAKTGMPDA